MCQPKIHLRSDLPKAPPPPKEKKCCGTASVSFGPGSGSGSVIICTDPDPDAYIVEQKGKKNLDLYVLWLLYDFF